jgi:hypothetical protein
MKNGNLRYWLITGICVVVGAIALYLATLAPTAHAQFINNDPVPGDESGC